MVKLMTISLCFQLWHGNLTPSPKELQPCLIVLNGNRTSFHALPCTVMHNLLSDVTHSLTKNLLYAKVKSQKRKLELCKLKLKLQFMLTDQKIFL